MPLKALFLVLSNEGVTVPIDRYVGLESTPDTVVR